MKKFKIFALHHNVVDKWVFNIQLYWKYLNVSFQKLVKNHKLVKYSNLIYILDWSLINKTFVKIKMRYLNK